jgi:hypothetical protein
MFRLDFTTSRNLFMSVLGSADILLSCCESGRWVLELEELEAESNRFARKVNSRSALATLSYQSSADTSNGSNTVSRPDVCSKAG